MDVETKTFKELKSETERLLAAAFKKGIGPVGDKRKREYYVDFLSRSHGRGLSVFPTSPGAIEVQAQEPPIAKVANLLKLQSPETLDSIAWLFFNQAPEGLKATLHPRMDESEDAGFVGMIIRSFCHNRIRGCDFENIFERFQCVLAEEEKRQARKLERQEPIEHSPGAIEIDAPSRDSHATEVFKKSDENYDARTTHTEPEREEGSVKGVELPAGSDGRFGSEGHSGRPAIGQPERRAGDRLSVEEGNNSPAEREPVLPRRSTELTAQAPNIAPQAPNIAPQAPNIAIAFNDEQRPPDRGGGRYPGLAIEMTVCHRKDLQPIGTIREIYTAKNGRLRAKIEPPKKTRRASFVYFDCESLIEAKFHYYDYPDPIGPWKKTQHATWVKNSLCDVWVRREHPRATNWALEELRSLSTCKLKKIAREMGIFTIPGRAGKHSLMRAILAEQAIAGKGQFPIPNSQSPIPNSQPPAIEPNPANYYWLNAAHKSQAAALERLGWEFTANSEIDDLTFLRKYKDWEFYSVAGEPLLVANLKGASFAIDCSAIAGDWNKEIDKAKRAIKAVKPAEISNAPKQLNLLELLSV